MCDSTYVLLTAGAAVANLHTLRAKSREAPFVGEPSCEQNCFADWCGDGKDAKVQKRARRAADTFSRR